MATIVTRAGKGSALTFTEGDANFTNLNNDKIELTDLSVTQNSASGNGTLSYNNTTGAFTYTPPDLSSYITSDNNTTYGVSAVDSGANAIIRLTGSDASTDDVTLAAGSNITLTPVGDTITIAATDTGIALTDVSVTQNSASGNGTLSYNNSTGVFTYTPPDLSSYLTSYTETDPVVGAVSGIVKADGAGNISAAVAGTDYIASETFTELSQDTTPELGGALVCGGNDIRNPVLEDYAETVHSLGSTDSPTITVSNGNVQTVSITSGLSLPAFSDAATGQTVTLIVTGSGTASGTAAYKFAGGNTTLTSYSVVSIFYDGTTYWASIATDFQ